MIAFRFASLRGLIALSATLVLAGCLNITINNSNPRYKAMVYTDTFEHDETIFTPTGPGGIMKAEVTNYQAFSSDTLKFTYFVDGASAEIVYVTIPGLAGTPVQGAESRLQPIVDEYFRALEAAQAKQGLTNRSNALSSSSSIGAQTEIITRTTQQNQMLALPPSPPPPPPPCPLGPPHC